MKNFAKTFTLVSTIAIVATGAYITGKFQNDTDNYEAKTTQTTTTDTPAKKIIKVDDDTAVEKNVTESAVVEDNENYYSNNTQSQNTPSTNVTAGNNINQFVKTLHKRDGEYVTTSLRNLHSEYGLTASQIYVVDDDTDVRVRSDNYNGINDVVTGEEVQYTDSSCTEIVSVTLFYNRNVYVNN